MFNVLRRHIAVLCVGEWACPKDAVVAVAGLRARAGRSGPRRAGRSPHVGAAAASAGAADVIPGRPAR